MPNEILKIVVAGESGRTIWDVLKMMDYALKLDVLSREFRQYYQLRQIFK